MYKTVLGIVNGEVIDKEDNKTGVQPSVIVADAGIFNTTIADFTGNLKVLTSADSVNAGCSIAAGVQVIDAVTGSAEFSATKATATKVNVYVEAGTIQVQNLTGADINLTIRLY